MEAGKEYLFKNAQQVVWLRNMLLKMVHPQPPILFAANNEPVKTLFKRKINKDTLNSLIWMYNGYEIELIKGISNYNGNM